MIYAFAKDDLRKNSLVELLSSAGIDYDISEHDRSVVRILGNPSESVLQRLGELGFDHRRLKIKRQTEHSLFATIADDRALTIIAGPCAVESEEQIAKIAHVMAAAGIKVMRGGAYKPRTSPDSFQGLGLPGLKLLRQFADKHGMHVVTEVMDRQHLDSVLQFADMVQVGSRNMFNYTLLTALGSINKPVLLKRGMAATVNEWLESARYIQSGGNSEVILCERGIRTFEPQLAHTLDIGGMLLAKEQSGLPVIADASHAVGRADLVGPLSAAAIAAGADGVMVELHPKPEEALSDGRQALRLEDFPQFVKDCVALHTTTRSQHTNDA